MTASEQIGLVWFRRDLRLHDNPAWAAATAACDYVVPLFVIDPRLLGSVGPYRRRQLVANLQALDYDLDDHHHGRLLVLEGDPREVVPDAVQRLSVGSVYVNADVSPFARRRDGTVAEALDVPVHESHGSLVLPPGSVRTKKGTLSRVFTPFFRTWQATAWDPWPEPGRATIYDDPGVGLPGLDSPPPLFEGAAEAHRRLSAFLDRVDRYDTDRDRPDRRATSMLSADLRFGTLSPREVVESVGTSTEARKAFVRQVAWRDWYAHLLADNPTMEGEEINPKLRRIGWANEPAHISAWKGGFTGYPIVDAGMRELRETGWMHNRVRMITASFLVKDLLVDWRIGEAHFQHLLVDYEPSQNVGNWQWVAGTGPDASPYHRVFNPVSQSRKFDPDGTYIRRWVPEVAKLGNDAIHAPWEAATDVLAEAGVVLGEDYPEPLVDHAEARDRALAAYKLSEAGGADGGETEAGDAS